MKKLVLFAVALLLGATSVAMAQRTVTGKVTSAEEPEGVPMVAVQVEGTTIGTSTDFNGVYSINVPATAKNLKFSAMGLQEKVVPITGGVVNVVMESSAIALQEVQISASGYGVKKKVDNVGAAVAVGEEVIKRQTESNVINSLQGSVPGMQVSSASGQPGSSTTVRVRGTSSLNSGNAPLYVIDGIPVIAGAMGFSDYSDGSGTDPLSSLNAEDIESIALLKDASATSIYGSRASNGVIVITTKKGKEGQVNFGLNAKVGFSTPPHVKHSFQKLNRDDFKNYMYETMLNGKSTRKARSSFQQDPDKWIYNSNAMLNTYGINFADGVNTDWWDEVTRIGMIQDYSLTASGGTKNVNYYASVGYFDNKGIVIASDYTRYNARLNLDVNPTTWLSFGVNLSGSYAEVNTVPTSLAYAAPIWGASMMRPTDPVKNEDGTWNTTTNPDANGYNCVAIREDQYHDLAFQQQYRALFSPYLRLKLYKNLYVQTKVGVDYTALREKNYWSKVVNPQGKGLGGLTQMDDEAIAYLNITNTINWMPSIGKNNFNVLVGQEAQRYHSYGAYISGYDYTTAVLNEIANAKETKGSTSRSDATLASYFGNVEYDYDNRYYVSASIRRDGSSRFGEETKWGTFWSLGAKYRLSAEKFMAPTQKWLNNLTIRASYGTSGNQNVGYYQAQGVYGSTRYGGCTGFGPYQLAATNLKWESRNKFDVGLEFTVLNALTMEIDYYYDMTVDMIFARPLSYATGFSSIATNIGNMRNTGVEIQLNATLINKRNFQWTLGVNFTANSNKILSLPDHQPITGSITRYEEGRSVGQFYMIEYAGVDPATGRPRWYGKDDEYVYSYSEAVYRYVGSTQPVFYGGIQTTFNLYDFDLGLQFNYNYGNKMFSNDAWYMEGHNLKNTGQIITYYAYDTRWRRPGDDAFTPQVIKGGNNLVENPSTRYLIDGSYLRLKSVMLGYTLPKKHCQKIFLSSLRIYASIDNLFTVTGPTFRGYDPEAGLAGTQQSNYPVPINYCFGINVGF